MSAFDFFCGNERLLQRLKNDIAQKTLSHAYIIEGAAGCGKRTLAKLICSAVSCKNNDAPCMECINCDKIDRGQAPDVITVEPDHDRVQLGVDVIRRLREDAHFAPIELPKKFYIIPDARLMNSQAQNALLKILEEPPSHVMFLILCDSADYMLPTIRSRAPTLRLEPLSDDKIEAYLNTKPEFSGTDSEKMKIAVKLSSGSIGKAMALLSDGEASKATELYRKAERYLHLLAHRKNAADELAFYEYAVKLTTAKSREDLSDIYSLIANAVRDMILVKLTEAENTIFYTSPQKAIELAAEFSVKSLMRLAEIFSDAAVTSYANVNMNLTMVKTACDAAKRTR